MLNADPGQNPPELQPSWKRMAALAGIVVVLLAVVYFSPLHDYLSHWKLSPADVKKEIRSQIHSLGVLGPAVFMGAVAVLVAVGVPRLMLCVIAGMALGFWSGLVWAQLGTLIGNYISFVIVRAGGRDWARRFLSRRERFAGLVQEQGALGVILARQIPLPGVLINFACALLPISHFSFLLGTLIGQLPQAVPWTLVGAGALQQSFARSIGLIGLAVVIAVLAWLALRFLLKQIVQRRKGTHNIEP